MKNTFCRVFYTEVAGGIWGESARVDLLRGCGLGVGLLVAAVLLQTTIMTDFHIMDA